MPQSHLFKQGLVSTDQSSEDRLALKDALCCSGPSGYFHGIAITLQNILIIAEMCSI